MAAVLCLMKLPRNVVSIAIKSAGRWSSSSQQPIEAMILADNSVKIDDDTVALLQHLSLVNFGNETAVRRLEAAIKFADQLMEVDTTNVEPMYTVQEDRSLTLRDDTPTVVNCRDELLQLAVKTQEEYFIAPSGNIPIKFLDKQHDNEK